MAQGTHINNEIRVAIVILTVVALLATWGAVWGELYSQRQELIRRGGTETNNLARVLSEHAQRTIIGLDQSLMSLKNEYERNPARFSIASAQSAMLALRQTSVQVARIDASGRLADSSVPGFSTMDLSDREHFQVHRHSPTRNLFISKPVQGRASGQWSIQLTRRLEKPGGEFDGVMVVSLDPYYLSGIYSTLNLGSDSMVMLVGQDGIIRAANNPAIGKSLQDEAVLQKLFAQTIDHQLITGPADDVVRIGSASAVAGYPLSLWVGRSESDLLAMHVKARHSYLLAVTISALVLLMGGTLLWRLVRQQNRVTQDLSEKKAELLNSREALRAYAADLEQIANVAAHDLQEPLRRVVAYTQLLANHVESSLDQQGRDYVSHVVDGAFHMRKLVKDLEAFVAVDHIPMPKRLVEATEAVNQASSRLDRDLRDANVTVLLDVLPAVAADMPCLTEIFFQLLDNAIRYRGADRQAVVQISARQVDQLAEFSIRDNGRGIEAANLPHVFELFNRLNGVEQPRHTGIGLAIVRRMIERLGGRIWVESAPGEGTTFRFTLPLVLSRTPAPHHVRASQGARPALAA